MNGLKGNDGSKGHKGVLGEKGNQGKNHNLNINPKSALIHQFILFYISKELTVPKETKESMVKKVLMVLMAIRVFPDNQEKRVLMVREVKREIKACLVMKI